MSVPICIDMFSLYAHLALVLIDSKNDHHARINDMKRISFKLWHSAAGLVAAVLVEAALCAISSTIAPFVLVLFALVGGPALIYVSTEVIRQVKKPERMFLFLSVVILEFIAFFAVQYWLLMLANPSSFEGLAASPVSFLLHSTMVFALNPLYLPTNDSARLLLLINTTESLVLGLFVLQNAWQLRSEKK